MSMIYLDVAATTQPNDEVIKTITDAMRYDWYNPSSLYKPAYKVSDKIKDARKIIADSIKAKPSEIYFTSGGSEGNNMILKGYKYKNPDSPIIVSAVEHKSIIGMSDIFENKDIISVGSDGVINLKQLENRLAAYQDQRPLVSIQYANNETGVVQPIPEISKLVHRYGGMLHTDAVQAYPHHKIDVHKCGIGFMTISGHKFGCPKGIGFVFINNLYENKISPLIYGSQERELRGGTENTPYILGLAKAVELRKIFNNQSQTDCIESKRTFFEDKLKELGCKINCENSHRLENVINCTLPDKVVGELMMYYLGFADIYVSTGSACNSRSNQPSHVLQQIGLSDDEIRRTIRISFDFDLSEKDIDKVIEVMTKYIKERKC